MRLTARRVAWSAMAVAVAGLAIPAAASEDAGAILDFSEHWAGFVSLAVFVVAYALVIGEETLHLRKSKPVMAAAGIIWVFVAIAYAEADAGAAAEAAVRHNLLEFAELFLFLLAAMTYINAMDERGVFARLRAWLISQGYSYRTLFWVTGGIAFVLSPIADNLTTALLMATVIVAIGAASPKFVVLACINVIVAANAGGAFSPFGDITTLMVWQKGVIAFEEFFVLFVPSLVNWLIPAAIMMLAVPRGRPDPVHERARLHDGAWVVVGLFVVTVAMAVAMHSFLHLPPVLGMMTGLGVLKLYGYYLKRGDTKFPPPAEYDLSDSGLRVDDPAPANGDTLRTEPFDIFRAMERAEWDTLMFFYGIILCVGGLGAFGYLGLGADWMYGLGPTTANVLVGILSAIIDNIPIMFAVLSVAPEMNHGQWLLVTLTAGVGGSMLSIGSAAGVAVLGQARGIYTFTAHLKWTPVIALGYAASIAAHFLVNAAAFD
jgi:Na+/H+ antiporter NhaD/arsenite permease-like protein